MKTFGCCCGLTPQPILSYQESLCKGSRVSLCVYLTHLPPCFARRRAPALTDWYPQVIYKVRGTPAWAAASGTRCSKPCSPALFGTGRLSRAGAFSAGTAADTLWKFNSVPSGVRGSRPRRAQHGPGMRLREPAGPSCACPAAAPRGPAEELPQRPRAPEQPFTAGRCVLFGFYFLIKNPYF